MKEKILLTLLLASQALSVAQESKNITVIGIGALGICNALCFERAGYNVLGIDISPDYIQKINDKSFISNEPNVVEYLKSSRNFRATTSLDEGLAFSDIYFIVVATPSTTQEEAYDHSLLSRLLTEINKRRVENKHIIICCTVFPGYIRNVATCLLKDCKNISISYNPEFIAQGAIIQGFEHPDMVLIGQGSQESGDLLESIYKKICKNDPKIMRMSPESAEVTKLAINCFITTKIAFANMIGDIADRTPGANKDDILRAIGSDSRIGNKCLKSGYGFGGPCFPRDNRALGKYAENLGIEPLIPQATDKANRLHAEIMSEDFIKAEQHEYIFEDVNYKENCPVVILDESQKLAVAQKIALRGKPVTIRDRKNVIERVQQKYGSLFKYETM